MTPRVPTSMRSVAVEIVREAMDATPSGDSMRVATMIRRKTIGWTKVDRLRLLTTLAWLAGYLALRLDPATREEVFDLATMTSDELVKRLAGELAGNQEPGSANV